MIKDKPDFPASKASAQSDYSKSNFESRSSSLAEYKSSIVTLMKNSPYILLLVSYGKLFSTSPNRFSSRFTKSTCFNFAMNCADEIKKCSTSKFGAR